jgi:hypothetical protein
MRKYIKKKKNKKQKQNTTTKHLKTVTKPTIKGINQKKKKKEPKVYIKTLNCNFAKLSNLQVQF